MRASNPICIAGALCLLSALIGGCERAAEESPAWEVASDQRVVPQPEAEQNEAGDEPWTGHFVAELEDGPAGAGSMELVLTGGALEQRIDGVTTYRGICERRLEGEERLVLSCVGADQVTTLWPLEAAADGAIAHRAQPEIIYRYQGP